MMNVYYMYLMNLLVIFYASLHYCIFVQNNNLMKCNICSNEITKWFNTVCQHFVCIQCYNKEKNKVHLYPNKCLKCFQQQQSNSNHQQQQKSAVFHQNTSQLQPITSQINSQVFIGSVSNIVQKEDKKQQTIVIPQAKEQIITQQHQIKEVQSAKRISNSKNSKIIGIKQYQKLNSILEGYKKKQQLLDSNNLSIVFQQQTEKINDFFKEQYILLQNKKEQIIATLNAEYINYNYLIKKQKQTITQTIIELNKNLSLILHFLQDKIQLQQLQRANMQKAINKYMILSQIKLCIPKLSKVIFNNSLQKIIQNICSIQNSKNYRQQNKQKTEVEIGQESINRVNLVKKINSIINFQNKSIIF